MRDEGEGMRGEGRGMSVMVRARGEGRGVRLRERVYSILIMRVSARLHGETGYGGEGHVQTLRRGQSWNVLLPGLIAKPNVPTSSLAYDRRPARVPVRIRV